MADYLEMLDCDAVRRLMRHTDRDGYPPLFRHRLREVLGEKGCPAEVPRRWLP
jgi:hypothetical protein